MRLSTAFCSGFFCLFLGACTVGPEYQAPDIDAPAEFVSEDVFELINAGKEAGQLDANWWEGFSDPLLNELIQQAIENNQQIAAATARVRAAQANVRLVDSGDALRSVASIDTDVEEQRVLDDSGDDISLSSLLGALGVTLPLDLFGRNQRAVESALAQLEAAAADLRSVVLTSSTDVAREYLRLRGNQRQLELLRESVALQEKTLAIVRSRYESGLSPELDLRRAETSVERLRADIPPLTESLTNSRHTLANLTGQFPGVYEDKLMKTVAIPEYERQITVAIPLDVLRQRPDIHSAEANLKQTIADIGVAEADFYPVFSLFGQMQIGTSGITGGPTMAAIIGSLAALVEQVLNDGGAREANLEIAKAQADEALANYKQALLDAARSIETTLVALKTSLTRQTALKKAVQSSARSFEQAERLYQLGLSSFLDVVDAQRVLASAEQQLATERTNYATQIATLFRVLGTRITFAEAEQPAPVNSDS